MSKRVVYDVSTGQQTFEDYDPPENPELPPTETVEESITVLKEKVARNEQTVADNGLTQQELIELLIQGEVI